MAKTGFFPGSFDPITNGHVSLVYDAMQIVDKLFIGVGAHHEKKSFLPIMVRERIIRAEFKELIANKKLEVINFDNLTVETAEAIEANIIFRGLRDGTDFNYERQLAAMNRSMQSSIITVFLSLSGERSFISSTLVRQIAQMGGNIDKFVPHCAAKEIYAALT